MLFGCRIRDWLKLLHQVTLMTNELTSHNLTKQKSQLRKGLQFLVPPVLKLQIFQEDMPLMELPIFPRHVQNTKLTLWGNYLLKGKG
jgi:hypothetical protein